MSIIQASFIQRDQLALDQVQIFDLSNSSHIDLLIQTIFEANNIEIRLCVQAEDLNWLINLFAQVGAVFPVSEESFDLNLLRLFKIGDSIYTRGFGASINGYIIVAVCT